MKFLKPVLLLLTALIILTGCNLFQKTPDQKKVKNTAQEMINTLEKINKEMNQRPDSAQKIIIDWKNIKNITTAVIILIITIIVVTIIYFIFSNISFNVYGTIKTIETGEKLELISFDQEIIDSYIKDRKYPEAVVYLHRCSALELVRLGVNYNKNMTNLMLFFKIKAPELQQAFRNIYEIAEKVLFDNYPAAEKDFAYCYKEFNLIRDYKL